jgi:2-polyprenyl-3-methyl-5-hydroxy-6-metoxy-1,4-benzoquinol methylase
MDRVRRWNHNLHYHQLILDAVPSGARDALDVGCGEGTLTRRLRQVVPRVVGVDLDRTSIDLAESTPDSVDYLLADFLSHPFEPESFDVIASVATIHHLDATACLRRMRALLRPGGVLAVVGCARSRLPADLPYEVAGFAAHRILRRGKEVWEHPSPVVWPPPVTYADMRRLAARELPGARYRRHLLWRYSIRWTKPGS